MTFTSSKPELSYSFFMREPSCQLMKDFPGLLEIATTAVPMLDQLRVGTALALDYACKDDGAFLHGLRIKCVTTPAGLRWCIKGLHGGSEGSGDYYPLDYQSKMKEIIFRRMCYFHRRTPISEKLEALRAKYDTNGNRYPEPTYGFILHTD